MENSNFLWAMVALTGIFGIVSFALAKYSDSRKLDAAIFMFGWMAFSAPLIAIAVAMADSTHPVAGSVRVIDTLGFLSIAGAVGFLMYFSTIRSLRIALAAKH